MTKDMTIEQEIKKATDAMAKETDLNSGIFYSGYLFGLKMAQYIILRDKIT
jgi:hypothetical protein